MEGEIKYFKRVIMSLTDIQICLKYLDKTLVCEDNVLCKALSEAIIISYSRPFSGYSKDKISGLKKEFKVTKFTESEERMHEKVLTLRHKLIAHSDEDSYGVNFHISKLGDLNIAFPTQRRIAVLLSIEDIHIIKKCCSKIEEYLFEEQLRITNILPEGRY